MSQNIGIFLIFGKFVDTVYGSLVVTDFVGLPQDCIFGVFSGDICPKKICFEKICFGENTENLFRTCAGKSKTGEFWEIEDHMTTGDQISPTGGLNRGGTLPNQWMGGHRPPICLISVFKGPICLILGRPPHPGGGYG